MHFAAFALLVTTTLVVFPTTLLVFLPTTSIHHPLMPTVLDLILASRPLLVKSFKCYQYGLLYMLVPILALRPLLVKSLMRRQPCQQFR